MANNTERTLCFGFKPSPSIRPPGQKERKVCECMSVFPGEETGVKHVGVKIEVPPPAVSDFWKVTNSQGLNLVACKIRIIIETSLPLVW